MAESLLQGDTGMTGRIRGIVLAGLCGAALAGCTWLNDWPPADAPRVTTKSAAPPPPQTRLMQTADATWLAPEPAQAPVAHMVPAHGERADTLTRINELENELAGLRNDMSMMLPAMTQ